MFSLCWWLLFTKSRPKGTCLSITHVPLLSSFAQLAECFKEIVNTFIISEGCDETALGRNLERKEREEKKKRMFDIDIETSQMAVYVVTLKCWN